MDKGYEFVRVPVTPKMTNLTGKRIGRLTALYPEDKISVSNGKKRCYWHCRCDCGNETDVSCSSLIHGHTNSCGCLKKERSREQGYKNRKYDHLEGKTFGHLLVLEKADSHFWKCKCLGCGKVLVVSGSDLAAGKRTSCGCMTTDRSMVQMNRLLEKQKKQAKEKYMAIDEMTNAGVRAKVIGYEDRDHMTVQFEDGSVFTMKACLHPAHPALNGKNKDMLFAGFQLRFSKTNWQFRLDDGTPIYHAKCSVCGLEDLLSPQQMIEHAKKHGWKAETTHVTDTTRQTK